jgi:iron-sulfur cluster assembly accessory protein
MSTQTAHEPVLRLTEAAIDEIKAIQQKPDHAGQTLRVYVEQGGCSGMQYGLVFDEARDGDETVEAGGVTVLVDSFSAQYIRGSTVDYSDALTGGGFKITNPNAHDNCGCGKSFRT